jgi:hypothetical protein
MYQTYRMEPFDSVHFTMLQALRQNRNIIMVPFIFLFNSSVCFKNETLREICLLLVTKLKTRVEEKTIKHLSRSGFLRLKCK